MKKLPTLKQLENTNLIKVVDKFTDHLKVAKKLEPLVRFIDFDQIKGEILVEIIEPLEIVSFEIILSIYRHRVLSNDIYSNGIRGKPLKRDYALDESEAFGYAANHHNVRAKMMKVFSNGCYYVCFWSKHCIRYFWAGSQPTGCVLRLNGH
ncbi:hypothetical protein RclHR1_12620002 [Rhizophagus clarus]|uniref:Uncharacterized protein n=1 Tax=Rhizophagus clarus TaxID=94130 RepID=A0A2Z6Q9E6_9GLOM|nr:hypothetical protein RclHR1_12620002 [Rhizophagus clarus]